MKLDLHRSITFWAGILVFVFIGWAWRDSKRQSTSGFAGRFQVDHSWGGVSIACLSAENPSRPFWRRWERKSLKNFTWAPLPELFPAPQFIRRANVLEDELNEIARRLPNPHQTKRDPLLFTRSEYLKLSQMIGGTKSKVWTLFLPHWLIMLAITLPWSLLLLWRARRRKRSVLA